MRPLPRRWRRLNPGGGIIELKYDSRFYDGGRLYQRGTATFDGRRVSRLVAAEAGQQFVFFVTAESGEPVAMTVRPLALIARGARFTGTVVRFLSYRRLPIDASSRAQLDMAPHSEARLIELGRSRCPQR